MSKYNSLLKLSDQQNDRSLCTVKMLRKNMNMSSKKMIELIFFF